MAKTVGVAGQHPAGAGQCQGGSLLGPRIATAYCPQPLAMVSQAAHGGSRSACQVSHDAKSNMQLAHLHMHGCQRMMPQALHQLGATRAQGRIGNGLGCCETCGTGSENGTEQWRQLTLLSRFGYGLAPCLHQIDQLRNKHRQPHPIPQFAETTGSAVAVAQVAQAARHFLQLGGRQDQGDAGAPRRRAGHADAAVRQFGDGA